MRQNGNNIIEHYLCIWVRYQQHMYRCSAVSCLRLLSFPFCFDYVRIENHMKRQCGLLAWCRCSMVHASSICRRTKCAKCERNSFAVDAYGLKDYWHLVIESETFSFYFWCRSQRRCCGSDCVVFLASSLVFLCRLRTKYVWFEAVRCENIIHLLPLLSVALRFRWLCPHTCECDASLCVCATEYFYGNRNSRRVFNAHACSPECSTTNTNNELHFHWAFTESWCIYSCWGRPKHTYAWTVKRWTTSFIIFYYCNNNIFIKFSKMRFPPRPAHIDRTLLGSFCDGKNQIKWLQMKLLHSSPLTARATGYTDYRHRTQLWISLAPSGMHI